MKKNIRPALSPNPTSDDWMKNNDWRLRNELAYDLIMCPIRDIDNPLYAVPDPRRRHEKADFLTIDEDHTKPSNCPTEGIITAMKSMRRPYG